jgi:hypothetical protein
MSVKIKGRPIGSKSVGRPKGSKSMLSVDKIIKLISHNYKTLPTMQGIGDVEHNIPIDIHRKPQLWASIRRDFRPMESRLLRQMVPGDSFLVFGPNRASVVAKTARRIGVDLIFKRDPILGIPEVYRCWKVRDKSTLPEDVLDITPLLAHDGTASPPRRRNKKPKKGDPLDMDEQILKNPNTINTLRRGR